MSTARPRVTPQRAAEEAGRIPCAELLAGLGVDRSTSQATIQGCRYDVEVFASSDLTRERELPLFSLLEKNMKPLYDKSPQTWTPRIKRGEMRMVKSRFLVLYANQDQDEGVVRKEHREEPERGRRDNTSPDEPDDSDRQGPTRKRAALWSSSLGRIVDKRPRISRPRKGTAKQIAGYTMFQFDTDPYGPDDAKTQQFSEVSCAYLYEVQVASPFRGRGIGAWMLDHMTRLAKHAGMEQLRLTCFQSNAGARRLYERAGFAVDGFTPLDDPDCDYLIMSKNVSSLPHKHS